MLKARLHRRTQHSICSTFVAPVAQLDRVPDYESGGRRFESSRARHQLKMQDTVLSAPVAQLDRVPDYESGGRRFESSRARQIPKPRPKGRGFLRSSPFVSLAVPHASALLQLTCSGRCSCRGSLSARCCLDLRGWRLFLQRRHEVLQRRDATKPLKVLARFTIVLAHDVEPLL